MYYRRFGSSAWLTLVFPIAMTAVDFFSSSGSPFGSFGAIAYTQRGFITRHANRIGDRIMGNHLRDELVRESGKSCLGKRMEVHPPLPHLYRRCSP